MVLEGGCITARQIEAARVMTRKTKEVGRFGLSFFRHTNFKKTAVRMGKGKGSIDHYTAKVRPGRILYEIKGIDEDLAAEAYN